MNMKKKETRKSIRKTETTQDGSNIGKTVKSNSIKSSTSAHRITKKYLVDLIEDAKFSERGGEVAHYIPELRMALDTKVGVSIHFPDGKHLSAGDSSRYIRSPKDGSIREDQRENDDSFTIQSVSKIFALLHVLELHGAEEVFRRVGKEPTGDAFNDSPRIKKVGDVRMPYNPLINVGAILITSLFEGLPNSISPSNKDNEFGKDSAFGQFLQFVETLCGVHNSVCGGKRLVVDEAVFTSERATGHNNRALAWTMDADGVFPKKLALTGELKQSDIEKLGKARIEEVAFVESVLNNYFRQCSILVTSDHLAHAASVLANGGVIPGEKEPFIKKENVTTAIALMSSCGMYDGSGEFAHNIGIPGKSGVGGGIMCVVPGRMGIATFAPPLDIKGNTARGLYMLRKLSQKHDLSVFQRPPSALKLEHYNSDEKLNQLVEEMKYDLQLPDGIKKADYIPELGAMDALSTGVAICYRDESGKVNVLKGGDTGIKFTLQSIGTLFALLYVLKTQSEEIVFSNVGKEPSGEAYDNIKWLKPTHGRRNQEVPFNPLINAGAIIISAMVPKEWPKQEDSTATTESNSLVSGANEISPLDVEEFLEFIRDLCSNQEITIEENVFDSERKTGFKNRSIAWTMNDRRVFDDLLRRHSLQVDNTVIEQILGVYFRTCSITVDCVDLAKFGALLANGGRDIETDENLIPRRHVAIANALMSSSGLFDGSGEFAYKVGIPAKSGVSGGLVGVIPGKAGIAVFNPAIDDKGNSYRGQEILKRVVKAEGWSIFASSNNRAVSKTEKGKVL